MLSKPENRGVMHLPDSTGHTDVATWNPADPVQVAEVRAEFDKITAIGYRAYKSEPGNAQNSEVISAFDPDAREITFFRQLAGG